MDSNLYLIHEGRRTATCPGLLIPCGDSFAGRGQVGIACSYLVSKPPLPLLQMSLDIRVRRFVGLRLHAPSSQFMRLMLKAVAVSFLMPLGRETLHSASMV